MQAHPDARAFRIKTIPYYSDLCLIYGDATVEDKGKILTLILSLTIVCLHEGF